MSPGFPKPGMLIPLIITHYRFPLHRLIFNFKVTYSKNPSLPTQSKASPNSTHSLSHFTALVHDFFFFVYYWSFPTRMKASESRDIAFFTPIFLAPKIAIGTQ